MPEDNHPSTHPPLPPTTEDDRVSWLRLLRSRRVGPATFYRLMAEHGSADACLAALPDVARKAGAKDYAPCPVGVVLAELEAGRAFGARLICRGDPQYPSLLTQIPDAPPVIWALGDTTLLNNHAIAMVGARNASSLGRRMAKGLAQDLGQAGHVIVSGLARGIDTQAHEAALPTGTIAVMAGGVDVIYPNENKTLAQKVAETGILISEQPIGLVPQARNFPSRNRIISGLAPALVVVEAAAKSGSLITAKAALDQGREVLAVPGHPFDARAAGCNMLIRDGATLVRNGNDVIEALDLEVDEIQTTSPQPDLPIPPPSARPKDRRSLRDTAQLHQQILNRLGPTPLAEDQLIRDLGSGASDVAPALTDMEIEGHIIRHPGGLLSRRA